MTPFLAFVIGAFCSGTVLAIFFGALCLEAEERAYLKGYNDALQEVEK